MTVTARVSPRERRLAELAAEEAGATLSAFAAEAVSERARRLLLGADEAGVGEGAVVATADEWCGAVPVSPETPYGVPPWAADVEAAAERLLAVDRPPERRLRALAKLAVGVYQRDVAVGLVMRWGGVPFVQARNAVYTATGARRGAA